MLLPEASELVLSTLPSAEIRECRHILRPIDLYHIEPFLNTDTSSQLGAVTHLDGDRAVMKLPDGFLRLLYFKMSDWEYGVRQPSLSMATVTVCGVPTTPEAAVAARGQP